MKLTSPHQFFESYARRISQEEAQAFLEIESEFEHLAPSNELFLEVSFVMHEESAQRVCNAYMEAGWYMVRYETYGFTQFHFFAKEPLKDLENVSHG